MRYDSDHAILPVSTDSPWWMKNQTWGNPKCINLDGLYPFTSMFLFRILFDVDLPPLIATKKYIILAGINKLTRQYVDI